MYAVVHEGLRPTIPDKVPSKLRDMILSCLETNANDRPTFSEIGMKLE